MAHKQKVDTLNLQYDDGDFADKLELALKVDDPESLNIVTDSTQDDIPKSTGYILTRACKVGAVGTVKHIVQRLGGKQKSNLDRSLLADAIVYRGNKEIVKCLVDAGVPRTGLTGNGDTDILLAVRFDRREILDFLLKSLNTDQREANRINEPNIFGVFPLFLAIKLKQVPCLKLLMAAGANVNQKIDSSKIELDEVIKDSDLSLYDHIDRLAKPSFGDSLLHIILKKLGLRVFYKNVQEYFVYEHIFELFLSRDVDFSVTDSKGHSLLDEAIISLCDAKILNRLIEKSCAILLTNPYHFACFEDSVERLEVIKSLGFKVCFPSNETEFSPLFVACLDQNVRVVKWLLANGANPTSYANSEALCSWISNVNKFADDLVLDRDHSVARMTPLHITLMGSMSVFMSAIPIVEALCRHGVYINALTSSAETPLFYATRDLLGENNFPVMPSSFEEFGPEESLFIRLIQAGADPDIGSNTGKIPLSFCIPEALSRIALMFLEVATNLSRYVAVEENERKSLNVTDMSFLPLSAGSLKALVQNPRKLKVLCRKTILQECRGRQINDEDSLKALPETVLNYVTLKHLKDPDWYLNPDTLL